MEENYIQFASVGEKICIRKGALEQLKKVNAVIFDCDGVLLDIRESYNRAIIKTVTYMFEGLTGRALPKNLISKKTIYLFKKTGRYNNDWDLAYALLMFLLCKLPKKSREILVKSVAASFKINNRFKRFLLLKKDAVKALPLKRLNKNTAGLQDAHTYARNLVEVPSSFEKVPIEDLLRSVLSPDSLDLYETMRQLLSYPGDINDSLLVRIFEEIFCGPHLLKELYEVEPLFCKEQGLIENEHVILKAGTLDRLATLFDRANVGISSGRPLKLAQHTLNELLGKFKQEALVFLDEVLIAESQAVNEGSPVNLQKPNPFSLLKASETLKPFEFALYMGDSMEDLLMVKAANKTNPNFLFGGVYEYSEYKDDVLRCFIRNDSDLIIPSVNELPMVLKTIRGS